MKHRSKKAGTKKTRSQGKQNKATKNRKTKLGLKKHEKVSKKRKYARRIKQLRIRRLRIRRSRIRRSRNRNTHDQAINQSSAIPIRTFDSIFAQPSGTEPIPVNSIVWDQIVAKLPADYLIPDVQIVQHLKAS